MRASDEVIRATWIDSLRTMFPAMDPGNIRQFLIHRERFVEPLRETGSAREVPAIDTPVANLHLVTTAQIYPTLTNGESVTKHARAAAGRIVEGLADATMAAASGTAA